MKLDRERETLIVHNTPDKIDNGRYAELVLGIWAHTARITEIVDLRRKIFYRPKFLKSAQIIIEFVRYTPSLKTQSSLAPARSLAILGISIRVPRGPRT